MERHDGHTQSSHSPAICLRLRGSTLTVVHQQTNGEPHTNSVPHNWHDLFFDIYVHEYTIFTFSLCQGALIKHQNILNNVLRP